ncbi:MAG TPA: enolase C-terminal domain-like protein [Trebonia sp.]|nr:enolase C-terminal domain-like protein [Trebonia sp.]
MRITSIDLRACAPEAGTAAGAVEESRLPGGRRPPFVVVRMETDEGLTGTSFAFGTLDPKAAAAAMSPLREFFLGRDPIERGRAWAEFRHFNRSWTHAPIYAYGPFDNACWDITGLAAGLPVHRLLGGVRDRVPTYVSSMFLTGGIPAYIEQALDARRRGFKAYKIHPTGDIGVDLELYAAVRDAVGGGFPLMADPVGAYTYEEALVAGRALERLGYRWLEEPVPDDDWHSQRKLREKLDIPVIGTETTPFAHRGTSSAIAFDLVDAVRTDVSWRGGITGVMRTAALADAFGMRCELHTCVAHALDLVNLHCAAAVANCTYFELLYPLEDNDFGLKTGIRIEDGFAIPPDAPGLGIDYDWDAIDDCTVAMV